ncbi:hypothetical protein Ddc_11985 [Ditylenchus destructor]|nr:hypothetical protein Ddc_11985 [Ditylenchus destructor]
MNTPGPNELKVLLELTIASEQTTENAAQVKNYCFTIPDTRKTPLPTLQYLADRAMDHLREVQARAGRSVRFELMSAEYEEKSFSRTCVAMEQEAVCANVGDRLAKYEVKVKAMPETSRATPVPEIPVNVQQRPPDIPAKVQQQQPSIPVKVQQQQRPQSLFSQYGNVENVARVANPSQSASRPKPSIPRQETGRTRFQDVPLSQPRQIQPQNPPPMLDIDNEDWDTPSKVYQRDERHLNEPEGKPIESAPSGNVKLDEDFENSGFGAGNQSTVSRPYSKPQNPKSENSANVFGTSGAEFGKASKTAAMQGKNEAKETQSVIKWDAILKVGERSEAKAPESNAADKEEKLSPESEQKEESSELEQNVRTKRERMMQNVEKREKKPVSKARSRADRPALELSDSEDETTPDQNEIQKSPTISQSQTISVDSTGSESFCNSGFATDLPRPVSEPPQPKYAQNAFRNGDQERQSGSSQATVTAKRAEIDLNPGSWTQAESAPKNEEDHPRAEDTQEPTKEKLEIVFNSAQEEEWGGPAW